MARTYDGLRGPRSKRDRFAYNSPPSNEEAGGWIWLTREMLESPAWIGMPLAARQVVDRIIIEHLNHGGRLNGELPVLYDDFETFGVRRSSIVVALKIAEELGWIDRTFQGIKGTGAQRAPALYALTWIGQERMPASNRWRKISEEDARAIVVEARSPDWRQQRPDRKKGRDSRNLDSSLKSETGAVSKTQGNSPRNSKASRRSETGRSLESETGTSRENATGENVSGGWATESTGPREFSRGAPR
jgi:hypothetical protein